MWLYAINIFNSDEGTAYDIREYPDPVPPNDPARIEMIFRAFARECGSDLGVVCLDQVDMEEFREIINAGKGVATHPMVLSPVYDLRGLRS